MEAHPVLVAAVDELLARCPGAEQGLHVLDLGGGAGGQAVRLAAGGHLVTVVDPSPDALAALDQRARGAGVSERITGVQGDAEALAEVVPAGSIDVALCHGVLEQVDDPAQALAAVTAALRPGGGLSLVIDQRYAAVLARAVNGRIREARAILTDESGRFGPTDPLRRRFTWDEIRDLLSGAGYTEDGLRRQGVGVFTDLVPNTALVDDSTVGAVLADLEAAVCDNPAFYDVAAYLHVVTVKPRGTAQS